MNLKSLYAWSAVALITLLACFWAFWGTLENFHEGWYSESFWSNVGLMLVQYLSFTFVLIAFGVLALRAPRVGPLAILVCAVSLPIFLIRTSAAVYIFSIPLGLIALLFFLGGRIDAQRRAIAVVVGVPLLVILGLGIGPAVRVAGRFDDGNYGKRLITGNGVRLVWAPEGPGWTTRPADVENATWHVAMTRCACLTEDGTAVADTPVNVWRLPTVDEAVRSSVRHGSNAGGTWDSVTHAPTYAVEPDKESPLWKDHSPVIYWWTSTSLNDSTAYRIVYNGGVQPLPKKLRMGDLGFRAVRSLEEH